MLKALDNAIANTKPGWQWIGELAITMLGVHLSADRLDDLIQCAMVQTEIPWPTDEFVLWSSTLLALIAEFLVIFWALTIRLRTHKQTVHSFSDWWSNKCAATFLSPLFYLPTLLAGCWSVGMFTEDSLVPLIGADGARLIALFVSILLFWRFGLEVIKGVILGAKPSSNKFSGVAWALLVLPFAALATRYGLPAWGW